MKKLLKKVIPQGQRKQLRSLADGFGSGAELLGSFLVNIMPSSMKVFLKSHLRVVKRMDYSKGRVLLDVSSPMEYRVRLYSCHKEPETVQWIESFLKDGEVFFDVGANVGTYSLLATEHSKGKVMVYAFEPSFLNFPQLCKNIHLNGHQNNISPFNVALTNKTAIDYFNYRNLDVGGATHTLGETKDEDNQSFDPVYRQATLGFAMDDFIKVFHLPVPQHIKIDVDGNEWLILQGAQETLANPGLKSLLIELSQDDLKINKYLAEKGFSLYSKHVQGPPEAGFFNCIFKRI